MLKQLSVDTAVKLAKELGISVEQLVHTPRHIVLQKLAEIAKREAEQMQKDGNSSHDSV